MSSIYAKTNGNTRTASLMNCRKVAAAFQITNGIVKDLKEPNGVQSVRFTNIRWYAQIRSSLEKIVQS